LVHVPVGAAQAWHVPQLELAQHTPSTQLPVVHSRHGEDLQSLAPHALPLAFCGAH
jgi:hypothetical protein